LERGRQASVSGRTAESLTYLRTVRVYCGVNEERELMATKKRGRSLSKHAAGTHRAGGGAGEKPIALTLKVDSVTYVRLSTLRATQRRTNQDILRQALEEYLDRAGA
jgi:hypothetical protein